MAYISVVVPVYKAESCLNELYRRLVESVGSITTDFEIILVEDCGNDRSWEIIKGLSATDVRVKGIQFSRNFGQHYGITAGLDHCDSDWTVVMDCDLQDPPEEIPRLHAKALEGYNIVVARRMNRQDPFLKKLSSKMFYKIFNYLSGLQHDHQVANFGIISRKVVDNLRLFREQLRFYPALVSWMGFPTESIYIQHAERHSGKSTYSIKKLFNLAASTIIAYSDKPLRLSIKFGFSISFLSLMAGSYYFFKALILGIPVSGWASLIVSLYFLSGLIIAILGVIGIYLGKTFDEIKKRPLYIVSEKVGL